MSASSGGLGQRAGRSGACQPDYGRLGPRPLLRERLRYALTDESGPRLDDEVEGCHSGAPDSREAGIAQDFGESRLVGLSTESGTRLLAHGVGRYCGARTQSGVETLVRFGVPAGPSRSASLRRGVCHLLG